MNKISLSLAVGLLTSLSVAQMPMSKYVRTFTAAATRGYFFQVPVDCVVTHLSVPDETGTGEYVVALYNMTAAPPAFSAVRNETPVFYSDGNVAGTKVAVPATAGIFTAGDWMAVLGGGGMNTGNIANSYGASGGAANPSAILGTPIAVGLQRCGMQQNIGTSLGVGDMWSEVNGPISRISVTVRSPSSATVDGAQSCNFCPASNGSAALDICSTNPFISGQTAGLAMHSGGAANTGGLLAFGLLQGNIVIPGFGRLCILGIQDIIPFGTGAIGTDAAGATSLTFPIPSAATLLGQSVVFQGAIATSAAAIPLTNGLEVTVGN